jgi:hypothetical protein
MFAVKKNRKIFSVKKGVILHAKNFIYSDCGHVAGRRSCPCGSRCGNGAANNLSEMSFGQGFQGKLHQ